MSAFRVKISLALAAALVVGYACKTHSRTFSGGPPVTTESRLAEINLIAKRFEEKPTDFTNDSIVLSGLYNYAKERRFDEARWRAASALLFIVLSSQAVLSSADGEAASAYAFNKLFINGAHLSRDQVIREMFAVLAEPEQDMRTQTQQYCPLQNRSVAVRGKICFSYAGCLRKVEFLSGLSRANYIHGEAEQTLMKMLGLIERDAGCLATEAQKDIVQAQAQLAQGWVRFNIESKIFSVLSEGLLIELIDSHYREIQGYLQQARQTLDRYFMGGNYYRELKQLYLEDRFFPGFRDFVADAYFRDSGRPGEEPFEIFSTMALLESLESTFRYAYESSVKLEYLLAATQDRNQARWYQCLETRATEMDRWEKPQWTDGPGPDFDYEVGAYQYPFGQMQQLTHCPNESIDPVGVLDILSLNQSYIKNLAQSAFRDDYLRTFNRVVPMANRYYGKHQNSSVSQYPKSNLLNMIKRMVRETDQKVVQLLRDFGMQPRLASMEKQIATQVRGFHSLIYQLVEIGVHHDRNQKNLVYYAALAEPEKFFENESKQAEFKQVFGQEKFDELKNAREEYLRQATETAYTGAIKGGSKPLSPAAVEASREEALKQRAAQSSLELAQIGLVPDTLRMACYHYLFGVAPSTSYPLADGGKSFWVDAARKGGFIGCFKPLIQSGGKGSLFSDGYLHDMYQSQCLGDSPFTSRFDGNVPLDQLCQEGREIDDFRLRSRVACWLQAQNNYQACRTVTQQVANESIMTVAMAPIGRAAFAVGGRVTNFLTSQISKDLANRTLSSQAAKIAARTKPWTWERTRLYLGALAERSSLGVVRASISGTMMTAMNKVMMLGLGHLPVNPEMSDIENMLLLGNEFFSSAAFMSMGPMFDGVARNGAVRHLASVQKRPTYLYEHARGPWQLRRVRRMEPGPQSWYYNQVSYWIQPVAEEALFSPVDLALTELMYALERWSLDIPYDEQQRETWGEWLGYNIKGVLAFRRGSFKKLGVGLQKEATALNRVREANRRASLANRYRSYRRQEMIKGRSDQHEIANPFLEVGLLKYLNTKELNRPPTQEEILKAYDQLIETHHPSLKKDAAEDGFKVKQEDLDDSYLVYYRARRALATINTPEKTAAVYQRLQARRNPSTTPQQPRGVVDQKVQEFMRELSTTPNPSMQSVEIRYNSLRNRYRNRPQDLEKLEEAYQRIHAN